jgi:hypothetical protein
VAFFPLDRQLQLWEKHWSEQLAKQAVWLSGLVEYEKAAEILARVGHVCMSTSSVWRRTQGWGERFRELEETERIIANAIPREVGGPRRGTEPVGRKGVALDGGKIHIRGEGWKEFKVGCVFDVAVRPTLNRETGDMNDAAHAVRNSYVTHLGGPEVFGELVWAEARRRGWERAPDTEVLGDGAVWIWNLAADYYYDSRQIVDWYHGTEHLACVARLLEGEGTDAARRWFKAQETVLYQGHAVRIAQHLEAVARTRPGIAEELRKEAGYFRNNERRMNYLEMREEGWAIGSGMVESGVKQFKARFTGAGMRWSRAGAERLLPVRAAVMGHRFDELWQRAYISP